MPEHQRSALAARDASPDSVIFTLDANFSLFSSASASVDRCSFASDAHDRDSLASEISLHLSGHEESSSGPDLHPHPNKQTTVYSNNHSNSHCKTTHTRLSRKAAPTHTKALLDDTTITTNTTTGVNSALGDDSDRLLDLDSARSSFSLALKECQDRRSRSEAAKKVERRRPASLDLNNVAAVSSPRFANVKKSSLPSRKSGTFPSPGTPNYLHSTVSMHKGWSSERVPLHSTANRRHVGNAAMLPLANGRTLPSKWEDAERWIFSPVSGDGVMRSSLQQNRKPKSKSGPLGPPGVAYYSLYSPAVPVFDGGSIGNFIAGSPFSAGVIGPDSLAFRSSNADLGLGFPLRNEPCMARSVSVHGCSDTLGHTASLPSQEEKTEGVKDAATDISRAVSRRDMATQMSPEGSNNSSPSRRVSFSASTPSVLPTEEMQGINSSRADVRDVQVDERVTVTRWTKKHRSRNHGKTSDIVDDWRKKSSDAQSCSWDVSEAAKGISKAKREEAKITAWENLQKAKAEAAIRKLEMKLEKKRSSSMDKIMNKLRSAQKKAQEMRSSVLANQANQVSGASHKVVSFHRTRQMGSLSGCFTCHAF